MSAPATTLSRWTRVFGPALAFCLALQVVTGWCLATFYAPSSTTAWAAVAYIQQDVTLGWFIRGLHSVGASLTVALVGAAPGRVGGVGRVREGAAAQLAPRPRSRRAGARVRAHRLPPAVGSKGLLGDAGGDQPARRDAALGRLAAAPGPGRRRLREPDADPFLRAAHDVAAGADRRDRGGARALEPARRRWLVARGRVARRDRLRRGGGARIHAGRARARGAARGTGQSGERLRRAARVVLLAAVPAAQVSAGQGRGHRRARAAAGGGRAPGGAAAGAARAGAGHRARVRRRRHRAGGAGAARRRAQPGLPARAGARRRRRPARARAGADGRAAGRRHRGLRQQSGAARAQDLRRALRRLPRARRRRRGQGPAAHRLDVARLADRLLEAAGRAPVLRPAPRSCTR